MRVCQGITYSECIELIEVVVDADTARTDGIDNAVIFYCQASVQRPVAGWPPFHMAEQAAAGEGRLVIMAQQRFALDTVIANACAPGGAQAIGELQVVFQFNIVAFRLNAAKARDIALVLNVQSRVNHLKECWNLRWRNGGIQPIREQVGNQPQVHIVLAFNFVAEEVDLQVVGGIQVTVPLPLQ